MRFLLDQDVYGLTRRFLSDLGHDVLTASQAGSAQVSDLELLEKAKSLDRILVTRDRDFGALAHTRNIGAGIIYLRVLPTTVESVHAELRRVLNSHSEAEIASAFVVVEPVMGDVANLANSHQLR